MVCFLDLPRPIRETIYRHALVKARIFVRPLISMEYLLSPYRAETYGIPTLALLCASRKIYHESVSIYLGANIFSIVQVDMLAAARMENKRVAKNLQQIRKLELIFDHRDYKYMAQFLEAEVPAVVTEIDGWADESPSKRTAMRDLSKMHAHFEMPSTSSSSSGTELMRQSRSRAEHQDDNHEQHVQNMKEYLWGRTLTFVRQTFQLTHLYIDLRHCTCPAGCCRLAGQVLDWGWVYVWIHGLPEEVQVRGSSMAEKEVIARSLDRQSFRPKLKVEEVYDRRRVRNSRGVMQYNSLLRSVYRKVAEV